MCFIGIITQDISVWCNIATIYSNDARNDDEGKQMKLWNHRRLSIIWPRGRAMESVVSNLDQLDPSLCGILTSPDDHRMLVEPSCGAGLAAAYSGVIKQLQQDGRLPADLNEILLVVCGGHCITMEMLGGWKKQFGVQWMYGRSALSHIWDWNLLQTTFPRTGLSSSKENLCFPITNINPGWQVTEIQQCYFVKPTLKCRLYLSITSSPRQC